MFAHLFSITLGKGKLFCIWLVCFGISVWPAHVLTISFYFSSSLLSPSLPCPLVSHVSPSAVPVPPSQSLRFHCSSPCLFSCSHSPGRSKGYHGACARSPASCPAHPYASWPYHNAFDQTDTDRCHAKRNSSPSCCDSPSRARSWFNLHALWIPLHVGASYIDPWVPYWT